MARPAQQLPSSSLADIAFMVLIFFLLVSTMDQEMGLQRLLPPMPDPNQKTDGKFFAIVRTFKVS